ncbi:dihydroorotase [Christensenellaceae bacterium OttesenSCG-928-K19]|nr:dihydroorotase [Christensenellaceae bacterium OttesenSCG-928-K19]
MEKILIKNVTVINADETLYAQDILITNGIIEEMDEGISAQADKVINGEGLYAFPGFCDLHSHLRDPGLTYKEDILSGACSAAAGGFTTICCMPNTKPVVDSAETVAYIIEKAKKTGLARVLPVAAITCGMAGKELTDFSLLKNAGAVAFSDDGLPVQDDEVILQAMKTAKELGVLLMLHEEDLQNRGGGVANAGENAEKAGLPGISAAIEDSMTARDLYYAQKLDARIHICHVSTEGSVELVRRAKKNGVKVTCETGPHYISLTDEEILSKNANTKVNPPLREEKDKEAVVAGIADGTIDVIATDHAPHSEEEKAVDFEKAPFGLIGFETAFSLAVTNLFKAGKVELQGIARLMSKTPCEIIGVDGGVLKKNARADIAICDVEEKYTYQKEHIVSKAKNSPFLGRELFGKVVYTIAGGKIIYG